MKNLFFKSLSTKKWAILFVSIIIVFLVSTGFISYETTKKTVALTLNGQEKVVKTHASTIKELFSELNISVQSKDYLFPTHNSKVTNNLEVVWKPAKQVQIVNENKDETLWTTAGTVKDLLKEQKIVLNEYDQVQAEA